jgi:hypothetical protein
MAKVAYKIHAVLSQIWPTDPPGVIFAGNGFGGEHVMIEFKGSHFERTSSCGPFAGTWRTRSAVMSVFKRFGRKFASGAFTSGCFR